MNTVDTAVLAKLRAAIPPLPPTTTGGAERPRVHDGVVPVDASNPKIVIATLPYVVWFSNLGVDESEDLATTLTKRTVTGQTTYAGGTREQAKWAGQRARDALAFQALEVEVDGQTLTLMVMPTDDSQQVRRDDTNTRPGGEPLLYGVDRYDIVLPR